MLAIAVIAGVFAVLFAANMPDKDNLTPDAYEQAMNSINPLFSTAARITSHHMKQLQGLPKSTTHN